MPRSKSSVQPYLVLSTASSEKEAQKIAQLLVRGRLAACVNIVPQACSIFHWRGKVDRAREWLLVIKTTKGRLALLRQVVLKHHSYETPELIGWPILWGSASYLNWLKQSVR